jgi:hypothetical protein
MIAAVAPGQVHHLRIRGLSPVGAAIDMDTVAIATGQRRGQPEAWRRRGRNTTVEGRNAIVIAHLPGAAQRVIMARLGRDPGGGEALRRFLRHKPRDEGPVLLHHAQPMKAHRFDRVAHRNPAGCWMVLHGPLPHVATASFINHPGHETAMVQALTPGSSMPRGLLL